MKEALKKSYIEMAIDSLCKEDNGCSCNNTDNQDSFVQKALPLVQGLKLYKFRPTANWKKWNQRMLIEDKIWLASMSSLNDPFEFSVNLEFNDLAKKVFPQKTNDMRWVAAAQKSKEEFDELEKQYCEYKQKISVFSLTEELKSILMWSYYANGHKGYCIEYSAEDFLKCFRQFLLPVSYQDETINAFSIYSRNGFNPSYELAIRTIITKSTEWSSENEWRLIKTIPRCKAPGLECKSPTPTAIYLGCQSSEWLYDQMIKICAKKKIPLYKMKKSQTEYRLEPGLKFGSIFMKGKKNEQNET